MIALLVSYDTKLSFYPSHNKFILEGSELDGAQILVTNVIGQIILIPSIKTSSDKFEFNTSGIDRGVYFVTISKDGNTVTKKVIVD